MYSKDCRLKTANKNVNFESTYPCRICLKKFKKFIYFEGHFAFNAKCRAKCGWFLQCYICGAVFQHLAVLKYHLRRHINKGNELKRTRLQNRTNGINSATFNQKSNLHECSICQRNFGRRSYLMEHMVTHSKKPITKKSEINGDHGSTSSIENVRPASLQSKDCNIDFLDKTELGSGSLDLFLVRPFDNQRHFPFQRPLTASIAKLASFHLQRKFR